MLIITAAEFTNSAERRRQYLVSLFFDRCTVLTGLCGGCEGYEGILQTLFHENIIFHLIAYCAYARVKGFKNTLTTLTATALLKSKPHNLQLNTAPLTRQNGTTFEMKVVRLKD